MKFVARLTLEELILVVVNNHRFMVEVKIPPEGTLVAGKYGFTPIKLKAIANRNHWATRNVENAMPESYSIDRAGSTIQSSSASLRASFHRSLSIAIMKVLEVEPCDRVSLHTQCGVDGHHQHGDSARWTEICKQVQLSVNGRPMVDFRHPVCIHGRNKTTLLRIWTLRLMIAEGLRMW